MVNPACEALLHITRCPDPWGKYAARAEGHVRSRSIFVDLLLLCGTPVLAAANALVGASIVSGVAILVFGAVHHSMMTIFTTPVRPHVLYHWGCIARLRICCSSTCLDI